MAGAPREEGQEGGGHERAEGHGAKNSIRARTRIVHSVPEPLPPDDLASLDISPDLMRRMGELVVSRTVDYLATLPEQPAVRGNRTRPSFVRCASRPGAGCPTRDPARSPLRRVDPSLLSTPRSRGISPTSREVGLSCGARRFHRRGDEPLHRGAGWRRPPLVQTRGECPRLAARVDGVPVGAAGLFTPGGSMRCSTPSVVPASGSWVPRSVAARSMSRHRPTLHREGGEARRDPSRPGAHDPLRW